MVGVYVWLAIAAFQLRSRDECLFQVGEVPLSNSLSFLRCQSVLLQGNASYSFVFRFLRSWIRHFFSPHWLHRMLLPWLFLMTRHCDSWSHDPGTSAHPSHFFRYRFIQQSIGSKQIRIFPACHCICPENINMSMKNISHVRHYPGSGVFSNRLIKR